MMGCAWHEASVGTLGFFNDEGVRLKTIYIARMPEPHKATTAATLEQELLAGAARATGAQHHFRERWRCRAVGRSGADQAAAARRPQRAHDGLVDAFHVAQYVQEAANAIEGTDSPEARVLAATWRETLKEHVDGAEKVLRSMRGKLSSVPTQARQQELTTAIDYVANQNEAGRMNYADAIGRELSDRDRHHRGGGEDHRRHADETCRIPFLATRRSSRHDLPSRGSLRALRRTPSLTTHRVPAVRTGGRLMCPGLIPVQLRTNRARCTKKKP